MKKKAAVFICEDDDAFRGFIIRLENGTLVPINQSIANQIGQDMNHGLSHQEIAKKYFASYEFGEEFIVDIIRAATRREREKVKENDFRAHTRKKK